MKQLEEKNLEEIINKQFDISWYKVRYKDVKWDKWEDVNWMWAWYTVYTATTEEWEEFQKWLVEYIRKKCKVTKKIAEKEAWMLFLNWWLKTFDN